MRKAIVTALALIGTAFWLAKKINDLESVQRRKKAYDIIYKGFERIY